jgi:hypothetical protein
MSDFYNWKLVKKTRKDHNCFGCCEKIPSGSSAHYYAGVFEGYFSTSYYCIPCKKYVDENPEDWSEGFYYGDIGESRRRLEKMNGR